MDLSHESKTKLEMLKQHPKQVVFLVNQNQRNRLTGARLFLSIANSKNSGLTTRQNQKRILDELDAKLNILLAFFAYDETIIKKREREMTATEIQMKRTCQQQRTETIIFDSLVIKWKKRYQFK
jgi:hypothetical protein